MEHLYIFVERLYDPETREVFRILVENGKELTEEEIAEKTGLKINAVRRALNKLMELGLVTYKRQRDVEAGKLIFQWLAHYENIRSLLISRKKAVIERLKARLEYEKENIFYVCPNDGLRLTFDEALEYDMVCPRCGTPLVPDEQQEERIELLEKLIKRLEEEIRREEKRG